MSALKVFVNGLSYESFDTIFMENIKKIILKKKNYFFLNIFIKNLKNIS